MANVHLPSILGCSFGFGAAGCGAGSLVGMPFDRLALTIFPEWRGTPFESAPEHTWA